VVEFLDYGNQDICTQDQIVSRVADIPAYDLKDRNVSLVEEVTKNSDN
jgi:hypothetical protein